MSKNLNWLIGDDCWTISKSILQVISIARSTFARLSTVSHLKVPTAPKETTSARASTLVESEPAWTSVESSFDRKVVFLEAPKRIRVWMVYDGIG